MTANRYGRRWIDAFLRHRAPEATRVEADFVRRSAPRPDFTTVLDICSGLGRHANALALMDYVVTGIDRDPELVAEATRAAVPGARFVVLDMTRLSELPSTYDVAVCLWQSFGWDDEGGNRRLLADIAALLRPGGRLVLDVVHRGYALRHQGRRELQAAGKTVVEERRMEGRRETVTLDYGDGAEHDVFNWHLYMPQELVEDGAAAGLTRLLTCARFDEATPASDRELRMQLVFAKSD
jgi:SAM-dependent methyltransferase